jgi:hypothetical protein
MDAIERMCRLICQAENVNPDQQGLGCGGLMPRDKTYKLWEARVRVAEALQAAGLTFSADDS